MNKKYLPKSTLQKLIIRSQAIVLISSFSLIVPSLALAEMVQSDQTPSPQTISSTESDEEWQFSRFAIMLAPYAEMDLEILELKIQPYVEIRFDRKPANQ